MFPFFPSGLSLALVGGACKHQSGFESDDRWGGGLFGYCQSSAIKPHPNSTDEVNVSIFLEC